MAVLGCPEAATAVTSATFVEVWTRAASLDRAAEDAGSWAVLIASIAARRCEDWLGAVKAMGGRPISGVVTGYQIGVQRDLDALLAAG
jgi:hypothetical protein